MNDKDKMKKKIKNLKLRYRLLPPLHAQALITAVLCIVMSLALICLENVNIPAMLLIIANAFSTILVIVHAEIYRRSTMYMLYLEGVSKGIREVDRIICEAKKEYQQKQKNDENKRRLQK